MNRKAKIVATIGPASQDENTIRNLVKAGVDVARLNFSHGKHEDHAAVFSRLRSVSEELERGITIFMDMQGPKIRTGEIRGGSVELRAGEPLTLTTQEVLGDERTVTVDYPGLPQAVKVGGRVLLDDGNLELAVISTGEDTVETRVVLSGTLKPNKGVNLPGSNLDIPGFTEKDEADLAFGLELGVDAVAVSFVRTADDVLQVRSAIGRLAPDRASTPIIAKLERPEALENLDAILKATDGVMVARGDLGVEMSPEMVPIAQKRIISAANRYGKTVITATQMLDSMIYNPRPTRAEASDVANAVFDGTDAVMLSGETAAGKYPVQAVETMSAIVQQAEAEHNRWGRCYDLELPELEQDDTYFLTQAAHSLAEDRNVAAIAIFTKSGQTALLMSKTRPEVPILAFTPVESTYCRLGLLWGVTGHLVPQVETVEDMLAEVEKTMIAATPIQPGQQVVLVCGFPVHEARPSNMALLHTVREKS